MWWHVVYILKKENLLLVNKTKKRKRKNWPKCCHIIWPVTVHSFLSFSPPSSSPGTHDPPSQRWGQVLRCALFFFVVLSCPLPWFCHGAPGHPSSFCLCHLSSHPHPPHEQLLAAVGAGAGSRIVGGVLKKLCW
jgi:hypothetical protein